MIVDVVTDVLMVTEVSVAVTVVVATETDAPTCVVVIVTSWDENVTVWAREVVLGIDDTIGSNSMHCAELLTAEKIYIMIQMHVHYELQLN